MKTSEKYFERFKEAFLYWQEKLGLTQYEIFFHHHCEDGFYAEIKVDEKGKAADVFLAAKIKNPKADAGPKSHAKHEALHLLLHRLGWLGECRYIDPDQLFDETEGIVRRLEKVLK